METKQALTVGTVARLAGVTVRTLHHYDEVGLLSPKARSGGGYRLYGPDDIERLQEILFFRELGFGLNEITEIIARPTYARHSALASQRTLLEKRADRLLGMIDAIDDAIKAERNGISMSTEEMLEVFDGFDPGEYEVEVRQRWGDTDAYRESSQRAARYTTKDWQQMQSEAADIGAAFLSLMRDGAPAGGPRAAGVVDRHRAHITKWFYDCAEQVHAGLGQMYVADQRFTENIDKAAPGLAQYMADAIAARYAG